MLITSSFIKWKLKSHRNAGQLDLQVSLSIQIISIEATRVGLLTFSTADFDEYDWSIAAPFSVYLIIDFSEVELCIIRKLH